MGSAVSIGDINSSCIVDVRAASRASDFPAFKEPLVSQSQKRRVFVNSKDVDAANGRRIVRGRSEFADSRRQQVED